MFMTKTEKISLAFNFFFFFETEDHADYNIYNIFIPFIQYVDFQRRQRYITVNKRPPNISSRKFYDEGKKQTFVRYQSSFYSSIEMLFLLFSSV